MINASFLVATLLVALAQPAEADRYSAPTSEATAEPTSTSPSGDPTIKGRVSVADEIKLPAKEPGVLVHLAVKEGTQVEAGQIIGKIDDSEPHMQKNAAAAAYAAAYQRWKDDIEIKFAEKAAEVAKADYEMMVEANQQAEKSISLTEVRRAKLEWDKLILSIVKSKHDRDIAAYEAKTKKVELDAAEMAIQRRVIVAPFDGIVEEIKRKQEEWVAPGDPILHLLRLDTVRIDGAINQSRYDPHEIQGCQVTVEVELARGRKVTVPGRIIKVSSIVRSDGVYNVRAEVANRQEQGSWVLRDGLRANMTIHLGTGGLDASNVSRAEGR